MVAAIAAAVVATLVLGFIAGFALAPLKTRWCPRCQTTTTAALVTHLNARKRT